MSLWLFVKSFTCQLQLSIIVGKLHHANSVSGKHSGYIIKLKGSENFTDFSTLLLLHQIQKSLISID